MFLITNLILSCEAQDFVIAKQTDKVWAGNNEKITIEPDLAKNSRHKNKQLFSHIGNKIGAYPSATAAQPKYGVAYKKRVLLVVRHQYHLSEYAVSTKSNHSDCMKKILEESEAKDAKIWHYFENSRTIQQYKNRVTKKRIFWGNGYSFASTCLGIKSYAWLKLL